LNDFRKILDSEVAVGIRDTVMHSAVKLDEIISSASANHQKTVAEVQQGHVHVETLLEDRTRSWSDQLNSLGQASQKRQQETLSTINEFLDQLRSGQMFPSLPKALTDVDPSLKAPAMNGHEAIENAVLSALKFRMMSIREAEVDQAHTHTLDWIYEDSDIHYKPWDNFITWLRRGSGCYWMGGKAGSGKSTAIKFVSRAPKTHDILREWARPHRLIIASYFFWSAGTELQKNQESLLRSLLFTILSQRRDLIPLVCPSIYETMM
jgi:hypothetical protein